MKQVVAVGMSGVIALLGLAGCATPYAVAPEAAQGQGVRYEHGSPTVVSVREHGVVRVSPSSKGFAGRLIFNVVAFNNGPNSANIGYENVSAATSAGLPMRLYTVADLEREARTKAAWAALAVALAGAAQSYSAQQSAYSYGYGSVHTYTRYGGVHSTYNYRTYNPALANALTQQAANDTTAGIYQISAALDQAIQGLEGRILQTTTVDVGQIAGGQVVIEKPKMAKDALTDVIVRVEFNGDLHEFKFRAGAEQQIAQLPMPSTAAPVTMAAASSPAPTNNPPLSNPPQVGPAMLASAPISPPPQNVSPPLPATPKPCGIVPQRNGTVKLVPC